jgi:Flp pilus assembly protein CpaB
MRTRIVTLIIGLLSLASGALAGTYAYHQYNRLVVTADIVVPAVPVPPYTRITSDLLKVRQVPRPLLQEPVYQTADQLVGKISTVPLIPDEPVYLAYAVSLSQFRLSSDPQLEVVSFPVDPAQAVGGQVRAGSRVNIYRAAVRRPSEAAASSTQVISTTLSAVQVLASYVHVVDVRGGRGEPVQALGTTRDVATTTTGDASRTSSSGPSQQQQVPVQIVTVAVPPEVASQIVGLAAEQKAGVQLWVSLAPVSSTLTTTGVLSSSSVTYTTFMTP